MPRPCFHMIIIIALIGAIYLEARPCRAGEVIDMNPEQVAALLAENPDIAVIDLRTPPEFREGHLKGAININAIAPDFERLLRNDKRLQDHDWLVYCRTGHRSSNAMPVLQRVAEKNIYHLEKGIESWIKAGYDLEK